MEVLSEGPDKDSPESTISVVCYCLSLSHHNNVLFFFSNSNEKYLTGFCLRKENISNLLPQTGTVFSGMNCFVRYYVFFIELHPDQLPMAWAFMMKGWSINFDSLLSWR